MAKIISYPLSVLYYFCFGLTLVVFHPIQWVAFNVFGYKAHKIVVDWLQFWLIVDTLVLGTRHSITRTEKLPSNAPIIIVSNHQSLYDIPPLIWYFRKHHVKFISKKELGKGIPSVSYNLRHGGSVLIDRKNPTQAIAAIKDFGKYISDNNRAAVIFPEGTRSKTGKPKQWQTKGLVTLFEEIPTAIVVPVTINNSWKMTRYGNFPMGLGNHLKYTVHPGLKVSDHEHSALIKLLEEQISNAVI
ncbi:MAG: lysophospholipid acyltransferase family protein [Gilvibacter sp.]